MRIVTNLNQILNYVSAKFQLIDHLARLDSWFLLRMYGISNPQEQFRRGCAVAMQFEALCRTDDRLEIVERVRLGLVDFRLKSSIELNQLLLDTLLKRKRVFLFSDKVRVVFFSRLALIARPTTPVTFEMSSLQSKLTRIR